MHDINAACTPPLHYILTSFYWFPHSVNIFINTNLVLLISWSILQLKSKDKSKTKNMLKNPTQEDHEQVWIYFPPYCTDDKIHDCIEAALTSKTHQTALQITRQQRNINLHGTNYNYDTIVAKISIHNQNIRLLSKANMTKHNLKTIQINKTYRIIRCHWK